MSWFVDIVAQYRRSQELEPSELELPTNQRSCGSFAMRKATHERVSFCASKTNDGFGTFREYDPSQATSD